MSPARTRSRRRKPSSSTHSRGWLHWWPLVLALIATPFAVRAASVLALSGPSALRLLYPSVALLEAHAPAVFSPDARGSLSTIAMWAQFPVYGLVAALVIRRRRFVLALLLVLLLHFGMWFGEMLIP